MVLILAALFLFGPHIERTALDSITYARPYLKTLHAADTSKAVSAITEVSAALNVYCGGAQYEAGGKCHKPHDKTVRKRLEANLKLKLAVLDQAIADLEAKR
jgi:hypothetical protein